MSKSNRENRRRKQSFRKKSATLPRRGTRTALPHGPQAALLKLCAAVSTLAHPILETHIGSSRCCWAGTSVVQEILDEHGAKSERVVVDIVVTTSEYRRRMGAFNKANPDPSVSVGRDVLDQWEAEGAVSMCSAGWGGGANVDCVAEGPYGHHVILRVSPEAYLDPTLGQFQRVSMKVPPGALICGPVDDPTMGIELGNGVQIAWELKPEVPVPPHFTSIETMAAKAELQAALAERGFKAAA